jgi:adenine-specific DNA-methyltransferase
MAIPQTFDGAFTRVKELVLIFRENEERYLSPGYSEAQARLDFIDKFWIALGWDVNHEQQTDPYKQEVKVERGVATSEFRKRADYAFLAPNFRDVRFFVEAKKPHAGIDNPAFYFQTIRYGWNNKNPLAVLTDFEELRILDCRYKPDISTALGHAKLKYHYADYADKEKFRTIYFLFSRQAVTDGSIEQFAKGLPKVSRKRAQTGIAADEHQSIDESFLQELDDFREELARGYKRKNPELDSAELTEVTQRTLDRLVFMRFLEDKLIETDPLIEDLHKGGKSWENFIRTSRRLDRVYNGIIFKEHSLLDSDTFQADERVFDKISQSLSHQNSPYDFNAIPIHILGSIYERFLGKVIVATAKQARVEDKPEVRKAGGVYYTPEYIVRYIVDNTVGKLIEGKSPLEIQEMRFADIACGSGSFLLGVYDTLLRYHTAYYSRTKKTRTEGIKAGCIQRQDGTLQLSLLQKRQILLNNVYGVDIDTQAVEVAQLSLYLKLLEDETIASAHQQQLAMKQALLPSLSKNIICGNSLIGWNILEGKLFDSGDERKLSPMNFEDAFPEVMRRGGFDAIVGNPPWGAAFTEEALAYLRKNYHRVIARMVDSYLYFLDRAIQFVANDGLVGFIIPSTILNQVDAKPVRKLLLGRGLTALVSLGSRVFGSKVLNTSTILITEKRDDGPLALHDLSALPLPKRETMLSNQSTTTWSSWKDLVEHDPHLTFFMNNPNATALMMRLRESHRSLGDLIPGGIQRGVSPDLSGAHVISVPDAAKEGLEMELLRPSVSGAQIKRYQDWESDQFIIYTTRETPIKKFPYIGKYLEKFKHLNSCPEVKEGKHPWWALHRPRDPRIFESPKVIGLTTSKTIELIFDPEHSIYVTDAMYVFRPPVDCDPSTIMAIMQSRLFLFLYRTGNQGESRIIPQVKASKLETLPVPRCASGHPSSSRLNKLARQMAEAKQQLAAARTERDQTFYESKCATLDRQIDNLVYELYDLTPEEVAIVEESSK